jgi:hypothetical protein
LEAPGIGSGAGSSGLSNVLNLSIFGGNVSGIASSTCAGIGSGYATGTSGASIVSNLSIYDGNVTGRSFALGAGIGSGCEDGSLGRSSVLNLSIHGGNVTGICSSSGSGIGSGHRHASTIGRASVLNLSIHGGNITAIALSGAAIGDGTGDSSGMNQVESMVFSGTSHLALQPGTGRHSLEAVSIQFSDASVTLSVSNPPTFTESLTVIGFLELLILYPNVRFSSGENFSIPGVHIVGIGNLTLPNVRGLEFCVTAVDDWWCFKLCDSGLCSVRSVSISLSKPGICSIGVSGEGLRGRLVNSTGSSDFVVPSFIQEAHFVQISDEASGLISSTAPFTTPWVRLLQVRTIVRLGWFTVMLLL